MENKKELLKAYLSENVAPILIDFAKGEYIPGATIIPANVDISELNGHYEGTEFMPPKWYKELITNKNVKILVIDLIDTVDKEEQLKFIELLEYRKISTFELPEDCVIIVTASEINKEKINEEIYSLVAQI